MDEFLSITEIAVYQHLRTKVKGKLSVYIAEDFLHIHIENPDNAKYNWHLPFITERLHNGMSASYIEQAFLQDYTHYLYRQINRKYFYEKA